EIEIPVFSVSEKARLLEIVTSNPLFLSQLLNRELPTSLFQICLQNNIHLFPRNWSDLKGECSCPDWAVPCKHIAAVLYLIANEIDKNPFLVFELHNFDLFKGLAGIGYTQTSQQEIDIPNLPIRSADTHLSPTLTDEDLAVPDFSNIPDCSEQIFTLLKEQPVFYPSGDFKQLLQKIYKKTVKEVLQMKKKRTSEADRTNALQIEYIKLTVDRAGHFLNCELSNEKKEVVLQFEDEDELIDWLHGFSIADMELFSPAMKGLVLSFYFVEKLVAQSAIIPKLFQAYPTGYRLRWQAAILNEEVAKVYYLVQAFIPDDILLYNIDGSKWIPEKEDTFPALLSFFLGYFVHSFHDLDYRYQIEPVVRLFFKGTVEGFSAFEEQSYPGAIHLWLSRFYLSAQAYAPVLQVDDLDGQFRVKIGIDDPEEALATPIPLQQIFEQDTYADARLGILRNLALMTEYFPQISKSVSSLGKEDLYFDAASFAPVLLNIIPTIRLFGIKVLLPKALQKLLRPQLAMDLEGEEDGKVSGSSILSLDSMLRFQWRVAIGDQHLSKEDFEKLVKQLSGIVKLKDEYAFFDEKDIRKLLDKLENPPAINSHELLQIALTEEYEGASVKLDTTARKRINELLDVKSIPPPQHLQATLRPYQQRGYEWLVKNTQLGFGSLIADDMGLGKTLQVIATLLKLKEEGHLSKNKALVIVPTTLLTNWLREIQKFAPALKAHLYHGPQRSLEPLAEADVLITTYGVVRSETAKLQKMKWQAVVIDEAQNIKNPKTAQTKAVKKMKAPVKIAMSGTPVENRLSEYWSIFDFSNTKYLGTLSKFKDEFARPIEQERDQEQLDRFRKITSPFILRRLKSDKSIIQDLPEKIEQDQFCQLSSEQAALYQNVLDNTLKAIEAVDGIHRRGLILKLITALK
ncbi:MAG: SNF2-related protein, partial [Saprospiraceae bacterium]|nr:SNF2-related protein [Saprospiraceae bacterium]